MIDTEEVTRLARIMAEHDLTELSVETDDLKLRLLRGSRAALSASDPPTVESGHSPAPSRAGESDVSTESGARIPSPIVGTFYLSSGPDVPPFVKVGDHVSPDTVVCVVEAMKVMNEIKAETAGIITRVLVENASPVEFGQPLFEIEPD